MNAPANRAGDLPSSRVPLRLLRHASNLADKSGRQPIILVSDGGRHSLGTGAAGDAIPDVSQAREYAICLLRELVILEEPPGNLRELVILEEPPGNLACIVIDFPCAG